jgi:hypothetical protein
LDRWTNAKPQEAAANSRPVRDALAATFSGGRDAPQPAQPAAGGMDAGTIAGEQRPAAQRQDAAAGLQLFAFAARRDRRVSARRVRETRRRAGLGMDAGPQRRAEIALDDISRQPAEPARGAGQHFDTGCRAHAAERLLCSRAAASNG